ncbi:MAG TPA: sigma-70 family RNA polymerase sigma factor [Anaeromyxobacteraceae bacterium]|nr:sigma-70 family RNA polymerase sigma factor [Anaeromyxobacteraceae bacterium]
MPEGKRTPGREPVGGEEDARFLARLRARDRAAFAALVSRHSGPLLRLATTFVRDRAVAEEVVQETWLGALTGLSSFEGRSSVRTWLFQILVNKARTRSVREGRTVPFSALAQREESEGGTREAGRFDGAGAWLEPPAGWTEEDPERLAIGAETQAAIEAAIRDLPEGQRAVITLRDVEGLEADEICNVLGITVTNQRVLLHRARAKVRQALEDRLGGRA